MSRPTLGRIVHVALDPGDPATWTAAIVSEVNEHAFCFTAWPAMVPHGVCGYASIAAEGIEWRWPPTRQ